jgi:hypothetical protein
VPWVTEAVSGFWQETGGEERKSEGRNTDQFPGDGHMYYTTRLLVFLAVTGGLTAAIVLSLSGELITRLFG